MLPNHQALALLSKGHLYSDTMTRGILIVASCYMLTDGPTPPIPIPPIEIGGGGGAGMPPPFYEEVKKKIRKDEKIEEIHIRLIRSKKVKDWEIQVELLETMMRAELLENGLLSDNGFKITVEWEDEKNKDI